MFNVDALAIFKMNFGLQLAKLEIQPSVQRRFFKKLLQEIRRLSRRLALVCLLW